MIMPKLPYTADDYDCAVQTINSRTDHKPAIGLILGSGLGPVADNLQQSVSIPYTDIPHFPNASAPGHEGRMLIGELAGRCILIMQGRFHLYEGYTAPQVTFPIRVMKLLGIDTLIITNAAGGINPSYKTGDLMLIDDHINLPGMSGNDPLRGTNAEQFGQRFVSMTNAYDRGLKTLSEQAAHDIGVNTHNGIYAYVAGPAFETPAEIRMLRMLGADAVGMSTVPEVIAANHSGMRVTGISVITNMAVDRTGSGQETTIEEVWENINRAIPALTNWLHNLLGGLE